MSALKALQRPPMQVRVQPAGLTQFLSTICAHAPGLAAALKTRPRFLGSIDPFTRDGLVTHLRDLRSEIDATLRELGPRPASDPLPPTPKPQPCIQTAK